MNPQSVSATLWGMVFMTGLAWALIQREPDWYSRRLMMTGVLVGWAVVALLVGETMLLRLIIASIPPEVTLDVNTWMLASMGF